MDCVSLHAGATCGCASHGGEHPRARGDRLTRARSRAEVQATVVVEE